MLVSDILYEADELKLNGDVSPKGDNSISIKEVKEVEIDQQIDPRLLQYAKNQNDFTNSLKDIPIEATMPLPTISDVPPTNLLPSDVSHSEISCLLGLSSSTAVESIKPRPVQLLEVDNKFDDDKPMELDMTSDDDKYLKVDEVEEVSILTACMKTQLWLMIRSRFFLFCIITVPIIIACSFIPFAFFQVDHICIFILFLIPGMFLLFYYCPDEDVLFIDDLDEFEEEESDGFINKIMKNSGISNYNPNHVYAF